jgi:ligand-binding sensor domain-containing protein
MNRKCLFTNHSSAAGFCRVIGIWLVVTGLVAPALAEQPQFNIVKPSSTGLPGEECRVMTFDPSGNLWVAARWPFWGESGLAMLPADQLEHAPLPGGGFDTGAWRVWSSIHHPIPSPYIHAMVFGSDGTAWVATDGGLVRFRPNADAAEQWLIYTPANSPMLRPEVRSVAVDGQGNVWITNAAVNGGVQGLFKLNPATGEWTHVNPGSPAWSVAIGNNDHVFVSMTGTNGMMEFDGTKWSHYPHPYEFDEFSNMLQDAEGRVWALSRAGYLTRWDGTAWKTFSNVGPTATQTGISKDLSGAIYISNWYGGVYKMVNDAPVFVLDAQDLPSPIVQRPNGDFFIKNWGANGVLGTVRQYDSSGKLLRRINTYNSGLPDYWINRMKSDSKGNLWFTSPEAGLSMMRGSDGAPEAAMKWRNWGNHNDMSEPYPWAGSEPMDTVFEDDDGSYWMGGNGIGRWNSSTGSFTGFWNWKNSNLGGHSTRAIVKRNGTIWAGSGGSGVFWFDGVNWNNVTLSPEGYRWGPNNVKAMAVDTAGNLWVGSEYGLRKFAPGDNTNFTTYIDSPLPGYYIYDVEADPTGGIWVATDYGLARFDGSNWTSYTQANSGLPGLQITDVARRKSDGLIAISVQHGNLGSVSTFDGINWTHYTTANSPLHHPQVQAVEFDHDGDLWASAYGEGVVEIKIGTPAPDPAPTPTASPTPTPSASPTPNPSPTPPPGPSATPSPGSSPTPSATPTPTPESTPTPTPSATATPGSLVNLSTRLRVESGDNAMIGGFIIVGDKPKKLMVRAIGPSLSIDGALTDPTLELFDAGQKSLAFNNDWTESRAEIEATTIPPSHDLESALVMELPPGAYTALVRGRSGAGIGLIEVYDLDNVKESRLANLSTRGHVQTDDNVMIGGLIVTGSDAQKVIIRAIGPSLPVDGRLGDPALTLFDSNGALLQSNDNWRQSQQTVIEETDLAPTNDFESAIVATLAPGTYTAIVNGVNSTSGVAMVEIYSIN